MLGCRSEVILPAFGESVTKQRGLRLFSSNNARRNSPEFTGSFLINFHSDLSPTKVC